VDQPLFELQPAPDAEPIFTVGQLGVLLSGALETIFPDELWVDGAISNLTRSKAGHVYFDLVEPSAPGTPSPASISVVLFSQTKQAINSRLKEQNVGKLVDGMALRVRAVVDFYPPQGRLQLRMTGIDPQYIAAAMAAERENLIARLHAEGITTLNAAHEVPAVPLRVGLVTSEVSAAAADFLTELDTTGFAFHVLSADARVQGDLAPRALVGALLALYGQPLDLIVMIRGGGSRGDLAVFDNEQLARAIAKSPVPVWTGIGHEVDRSVADVVAHSSFKTPTAVAAAIGVHVGRYVERTERCWQAITTTTDRHTSAAERHLIACARRSALAGRDGLRESGERLDQRQTQIPGHIARVMRYSAATLANLEARVRAADPAVLLARGWSITHDSEGTVVRSISQVDSGQTLHTSLADGTVLSEVTLTRTKPPQDTNV